MGAELVEDQTLRLQRAADTLTGPDRDRYIALLNHFKGFEHHQPDAQPRFGF